MRMKQTKFDPMLKQIFNPMLKYIDDGKFFREPFKWLYAILGILNLLAPIGVLVFIIDSGFFKIASGGMIVAFILMWLILCLVMWFGFLLWWNRREKVYHASAQGDDFVAIPVYSHFIQTIGEWIGMIVGIGGPLFTLIALLFGEGGQVTALMMKVPYGPSFWYIILLPIGGFLIVVMARALAEMLRALAAIANNTRHRE